MSATGPKNDDILKVVEPLLDAIAPEHTINLLERHNNPQIPARGWQKDFFSKKIAMPLLIRSLDFADAWPETATPIEKLNVILAYLFEASSVHPLAEYLQNLHLHAAGYIEELHVNVKQHLDSPTELDYYRPKALVAFKRMVNIQLAFNIKDLLNQIDGFDSKDINVSLMLLKLANIESIEELDEEKFIHVLDNYIQAQTVFALKDRILFRCHKVIEQGLSPAVFSQKDNSRFFFGRSLDNQVCEVEEINTGLHRYPASPLQTAKGFLKGGQQLLLNAFFRYPVVLAQKSVHYLKQVSAIPFRLVRATTQDLPFVGRLLGRVADDLNHLKNYAAPAVVGFGLLWLELLELQRMNDPSYNEGREFNPLTTMMISLSPLLIYFYGAAGTFYGAAGIAMSGVSLSKLSASAFASFRHYFSDSKTLMQIVIEENLHDFNQKVLTAVNLAQGQFAVLSTPIVLPEEVKVLLSSSEQDEIALEIAKGRVALCREHFEFNPLQCTALRMGKIWTPIYVPTTSVQSDQQPPQQEAPVISYPRTSNFSRFN